MPSKAYFHRFPPFPDDVDTYELPEISFAKLQANDPAESRRLFDACREAGFICLDLSDSPHGQTLLQDAEQVFHVTERLHASPLEELKTYSFKPPRALHGYKAAGISTLEDGSPDAIAFYNLNRDDILYPQKSSNGPHRKPPILQSSNSLFTSFVRNAQPVLSLILAHLETHLHLSSGSFASLMSLDEPSGTTLRLLKTSPRPSSDPSRTNMLGHTDIGAITMLFNAVGGLQILPPSASPADPSAWRFVHPSPNHAVINMGDALVEWSGGVLRSNLHRVVTAPGEQAAVERYSVAYLVRPAGKAVMKSLKSDVIPAPERGEGEGKELCAEDWQAMRVAGIMQGKNLARSRGGALMKGETK